jgi:hypothetical protein
MRPAVKLPMNVNQPIVSILWGFDAEVAAILDAMKFLRATDPLPMPVVAEMIEEDWGDDHGVSLTWGRESSDFYCRIEFDGTGTYSFYLKLQSIERQGDGIDVSKGALGQLAELLADVVKSRDASRTDVMDGLRFATKDEVAALLSRNPRD